MLIIVHKSWHGISPEGYRQVLTKINQNYISQQGNILLDNLRECHDHMSKVTDVEVSAFSECFLFIFSSYYCSVK